MDTDLDADDLGPPCQPMPGRPLSWWLVLASAIGLAGNVCRSVTCSADELAAAAMSHHVWREASQADLSVVDRFRQQLTAL